MSKKYIFSESDFDGAGWDDDWGNNDANDPEDPQTIDQLCPVDLSAALGETIATVAQNQTNTKPLGEEFDIKAESLSDVDFFADMEPVIKTQTLDLSLPKKLPKTEEVLETPASAKKLSMSFNMADDEDEVCKKFTKIHSLLFMHVVSRKLFSIFSRNSVHNVFVRTVIGG